MKTKRNPFLQFSAATLAAVTLASFASQSAQAASGSWQVAVDGNWGVNANWNGATFPNGEGQAANFSINTPDLLITTTLDGNYTVSSSAINSGQSADWLVTSLSNTLTFDHTGTTNSSIANNFNGSSLYTLDTNIVLNSNLVLSGNGNNNAKVTLGATVGGRTITGTGNITINNTGSSGAGLITINSNINTTGGVFNTSTLGQNNHLIAGVIGTGVTGVTQNSARTFVLSGNNTYTSATTVTSGNLVAGVASVANVSGAFGNNSAVTIADAASAIVTLNFNTQIGSLAGGGVVGGSVLLGSTMLTTGGDNANTSFGGAISGGSTSGLTKVGNGTFTLTGNNTPFTGAINVGAGTLVAGRAGNTDIGFTSAVNLNGGNLVFQLSTAFDKTYNGGINVNNAGTLSYDNKHTATQTLTLGGTNPLALSANLTVKNTSDVETLVNPINISRLITGSGDLIVETYNNIALNSDSFSLGRVSLSGNNTGWNGNLRIARGTVSLFGDATVNAPGNGTIIIGTNGDTFGAGLTFFTSAANTYTNNITINPGGFRAIKGGSSDFTITFTGNMTLDGNLTVDHFFPSSGRRIDLNGPISGTGGLTVTRAGGSTETSLRMAGANTYSGGTTVTSTASLALASTASLASDVLVQGGGRIGGPGTINAKLTLADTANFFFYAVGSTPGTFVPMTVTGAVTLNNNFSVANIVGGSRGEEVDWDATPDGTYTLIGSTASSLSNIQNFGPAAYATIPASPTVDAARYAYFQGTTGLQIVVSSTPPVVADPFTTWSGGAAFNVDTNNDGISNGLAFLLGASDVNANANGLLPAPTQSGGALTLTFTMRNAAARGTASLQVQHSSDLGISDLWSTLVTVPDVDGTDPSGIIFDITAGTPLNGVTATIPASGNAAGGKLFGRVKSNP